MLIKAHCSLRAGKRRMYYWGYVKEDTHSYKIQDQESRGSILLDVIKWPIIIIYEKIRKNHAFQNKYGCFNITATCLPSNVASCWQAL